MVISLSPLRQEGCHSPPRNSSIACHPFRLPIGYPNSQSDCQLGTPIANPRPPPDCSGETSWETANQGRFPLGGKNFEGYQNRDLMKVVSQGLPFQSISPWHPSSLTSRGDSIRMLTDWKPSPAAELETHIVPCPGYRSSGTRTSPTQQLPRVLSVYYCFTKTKQSTGIDNNIID